MKPDKLEQFMLDNKEGFKPPFPTPDVWSNIEKRKPKRKVNQLNWSTALSRAAAVAVIFVVSYYFHEYRSSLTESVSISAVAEEVSPMYLELQEAELYYASQISYKRTELFSLTADSPDLQNDISIELGGLDAILLELKEDLKDNADNQEVVEAMIQNYMLKLEILEDMLRQIDRKNNKNNNETGYTI